MIKANKPLKLPALRALLHGWNQPLSEQRDGKQHWFKKKELLEKVKARLRDPEQSDGDQPSPKRRRC